MLKKIPVVCLLLASTHLSAEVISDSSVGTQVKIDGTDFGITHGLQEGTNLFHSFRDFSIGADESATFLTKGIDSPGDIRNILARVTGKNPSEIFGSLNSDFDADLYLMNPNGIIFGENAFLNVNGSFHATTADYLSLGKDAFFYANLSDESHFISAAPAAFGFLSEEPAPITITGENVWLQVPQEKTLSMIGGDITIEDSILYAPSGRINLASVASEGEVEITENNLLINANQKGTITVSYSDYAGDSDASYDDEDYSDDSYDNEDYSDDSYDDAGDSDDSYEPPGNIDVSNKETLTADAGQVFIRGGKFVLKGGAEIFADTYQYENDGETITGGSTIDIDIDGDIELKDGARITAENDNLNSQGTYINIKAKNLTLSGQSEKLEIDDEYFVDSLSMISTDNIDHPADAGNINIEVTNSLNLNPGAILSIAQNDFGGNAGNIDIKTRKVTLQNGGMIRAESFGGYSGNIALNTSELRLMDRSNISNSSKIEDITTEYTGGNITLNVRDLLHLKNDSWISAKTFSGKHDAGNISIGSPKFFILDKSQVATNAEEEGDGGNINIDATYSIFSYPFEKREKVSFDKIRFPDIYEPADIKMSSIDASSKAGKPGKIWINASQEDFGKDLTLSKDFLIDNLSLNRCAGFTIANLSTFLVIGRDVSPTAPSDLRTHPYIPEP